MEVGGNLFLRAPLQHALSLLFSGHGRFKKAFLLLTGEVPGVPLLRVQV